MCVFRKSWSVTKHPDVGDFSRRFVLKVTLTELQKTGVAGYITRSRLPNNFVGEAAAPFPSPLVPRLWRM